MLSLSLNKVGDGGAQAFAGMLDSTGEPNDCGLHVLELDGNAITDAGGAALAAAMSTNSSLQHLKLCSNFLSPGVVAGLVEQDTRIGAVGRINADFRAFCCWHPCLILLAYPWLILYCGRPPCTEKQVTRQVKHGARETAGRRY